MPLVRSLLTLDLSVCDAVLDVSVINNSYEPARVWNRTNSWGWETLSLEIKGSPQSADSFDLTVRPVAFTRNVPGYTEIPAGGIEHISISARDSEWNAIERIEYLRDKTLWVRAHLRIPPSPEADTYGVFVGTARSPLRESQAPHRWLCCGS